MIFQLSLEVVFFRLEDALPIAPPRAAIVIRDPRTTYNYFYEDTGRTIPGLAERTIPERMRSNIKEENSVVIPITAGTSTEEIRRVLRDLPKVDQGINPGGMFPWTFGNYVKRFLREMEKEGLLKVGPYYSDEFYDTYLKEHLGDGTF
ncbi:hypothetical protein NLJ89_g10070 [Agrocybe chaxingu]|uniref:Uncharacterized protein n=1 Tax=Agrocybe chaxingu TaxID=84603 RepID=A0A9W8JSD3_9AGAR|nr:hypothetical protein NLJ89_g10070 [Agrocybe chaxingu]